MSAKYFRHEIDASFLDDDEAEACVKVDAMGVGQSLRTHLIRTDYGEISTRNGLPGMCWLPHMIESQYWPTSSTLYVTEKRLLPV